MWLRPRLRVWPHYPWSQFHKWLQLSHVLQAAPLRAIDLWGLTIWQGRRSSADTPRHSLPWTLKPVRVTMTRAISEYCRSRNNEIKVASINSFTHHQSYAPGTQLLQKWSSTKLPQGWPSNSLAIVHPLSWNYITGNVRSFSNPFTTPISIENAQRSSIICRIVWQIALNYRFSSPYVGCWGKRGFVVFCPYIRDRSGLKFKL